MTTNPQTTPAIVPPPYIDAFGFVCVPNALGGINRYIATLRR